MELELIADYQCQVGEGPMWHPTERCVYWLDIPSGRLFRYDPESNCHRLFFEGPQIGGFTLQMDGTLLLFMEKGAETTSAVGGAKRRLMFAEDVAVGVSSKSEDDEQPINIAERANAVTTMIYLAIVISSNAVCFQAARRLNS